MELLAVIAIVTLLATFVLFALFGVQQEGKAARTKAEMAKLHEIVMAHYDTYQYRPLPIRQGTASVDSARKRRLIAVRDLMRLELPDRITDVRNFSNTILKARPALSEAYLRRDVGPGWTTEFQGAECLYLIVSQSHDGFSPALEYFTESEFGDYDSDGMREILDGWGRPIEFLRWAPGYPNSALQSNDPVNQHDPFDVMRVDDSAYALYPLIYSAGPDKEYGLETLSSTAYGYTFSTPPNPYANLTLGSVLSGGFDVDNLTNHYQEQR